MYWWLLSKNKRHIYESIYDIYFCILTSFGITVSRFVHLTTTDSMFFIFFMSFTKWKKYDLFLFFNLYFNWRKIALQCVGFCHTTSKSIIIIYILYSIYILSLLSFLSLPHPTPLGHHRAPGWAPRVIKQLPTSYLYYTRYYIHVNAVFLTCPSLSFPQCVYKSILYICISIPSLQIGLLVPFFQPR